MEATDIGRLSITRITQSAIRTEATPRTIRCHDKHETLTVTIMLSGTLACTQGGRESVQRAGELVVLDRKPTVMETRSHSQSLVLELPRDRLERMLGSVTLYAGLTVGSGQASTSIVTSFLGELIKVQSQLSPDTAERMSSIAIDLLVASIAERLSQEAPKSIASTVMVQRAKHYIEINLGDPALDASELAIAMGISLRRLQQLFQEHDLNISDWIWRRRLEIAAIKLGDPVYLHLPIGILANGCGFISQTHFSRRFKSRYGMTAGEYRESAANRSLSMTLKSL